MSFIVIGLKTPANCLQCPLHGFDRDDFVSWCKGHAFSATRSDEIPEIKPQNCPIRDIPDEHGKIIDENYLRDIISTMKAEAYMDGLRGVHPDITHYLLMEEILDDCPAIIDAERENT